MPTKNPFKRGARVNYSARVRSGTGKITEVVNGGRGAWYEVKDDVTKETVKVRAAGLDLAPALKRAQ
jgi:hypothetical protein